MGSRVPDFAPRRMLASVAPLGRMRAMELPRPIHYLSLHPLHRQQSEIEPLDTQATRMYAAVRSTKKARFGLVVLLAIGKTFARLRSL